jgi:hypothetical protein
MLFETITSIILLYLFLAIQSLNIHYSNTDRDNNVLYNNITKYIKEVQVLFAEINNIKIKNNERIIKIEKQTNIIYNDIKHLQNISNETAYNINIIKDDNTLLYSDYSNRYNKQKNIK